MEKKYFPIKTETACPLKWNWSTLYMVKKESASCHRTGFYPLTVDTFEDFHNNPKIIAERNGMLNGNWPIDSCHYCQKIEKANGFSDRMHHLTIPDQVPVELETNVTAVHVTPTTLEICFNSLCNMACLYCTPTNSSCVNQEYKKFGPFDQDGVKMIPSSIDSTNSDLMNKLWEWLDNHALKLRRLNVLGGEPTFQSEFYKLLDFLEQKSHPDLELQIVTNLKIDSIRLDNVIKRLKLLAVHRKIKRLDIICSIDCWGTEQEYIRYGMKLAQWEKNFNRLLVEKWIRITLNLTISVLSIKKIPALLQKVKEWKKTHMIYLAFSQCTPGPSYLNHEMFGPNVFDDDFTEILNLMPRELPEQLVAVQYMSGISNLSNRERNINEIIKLHTFLKEKDRRNNTSWKQTFPWLIEEFEKCGITV